MRISKNNDINANSQWYLITICDPLFLPGKSIFNITNLILKALTVRFVLMSDLQGAGVSHLIKDTDPPFLPIDEFLTRVGFVDQFDWGDFFLFSDCPKEWQIFDKKPYPEIIAHTETTIRAIDDSYIYVYTPKFEIAQLIKENYIIEKIVQENLVNLEYPF